MARKTVDIEVLKEMVNNMCRFSVNESKGIRQGAMNVLEEVLHSSGNYKGFRYLYQDEMEAGYSFGINQKTTDPIVEDYTERFANSDNTRVMYF